MGYGGDFGDDPNDRNFVMDGLCFSNHTPTPGLTEYKKAVEPVQTLSIDGNEVTIINRYDIVSLDHLICDACLVTDGEINDIGVVEIPQGTFRALPPSKFEFANIQSQDLHHIPRAKSSSMKRL